MNKLMILALAGAFSMNIASAANPNDDKVSYKQAVDKAESEYKSAKAQCDAQSGNAKDICQKQAKVTRAQAEHDAVASYKNDKKSVEKASKHVADAQYDLAKEKCDDMSGAAKDSCVSAAKSTRTAAINDAKAGKHAADVAQTGENCDTMTGTEKAACVSRTKSEMAGTAVADTMITTKVKAELIKEPNLKSLDVHVETDKGVVMLSGFVPSQAEVDKAVEVARTVKGVEKVQSALRIDPNKK
ncbi:BON domain-containing protein [Oxalobacteraceae bacterium]|nr:BON domain-containing protein [Oxalobacteraceae bacterium]